MLLLVVFQNYQKRLKIKNMQMFYFFFSLFPFLDLILDLLPRKPVLFRVKNIFRILEVSN